MIHAGEESARAVKTAFAALVSGVPAIFIGPPGFGKTEAALTAAALVVDGDEARLWRRTFSPGTPPSVVQGSLDIQALMSDQTVTATVKGTLYDPLVCAAVLDELPRANPATLSAMLNALDRSRFLDRRLVAATANTALDSPPDGSADPSFARRMAALRSRFGIVFFFGGEYHAPLDVAAARLERLAATGDRRAALAALERRLGMAPPTMDEVRAFMHVYRALAGVIGDSLADGDAPRIVGDIAAEARRIGLAPLRDKRWTARLFAIIAACSAFERMRVIAGDAWRHGRATGDWRPYVEAGLDQRRAVAESVRAPSPLALIGLQHACLATTPQQAHQWREIVTRCADAAAEAMRSFANSLYHAVHHAFAANDPSKIATIVDDVTQGLRSLLDRHPQLRDDPAFGLLVMYRSVMLATLLHPKEVHRLLKSFGARIRTESDATLHLDPQGAWPPDARLAQMIAYLYHHAVAEPQRWNANGRDDLRDIAERHLAAFRDALSESSRGMPSARRR